MAELRVRNIEPWIVDLFRAKARRNGRSMEREIHESLAQAAVREKNDFLAELREDRERQRERYGIAPDSTPGIRAEREAL
jgi:plasmid stability protein